MSLPFLTEAPPTPLKRLKRDSRPLCGRIGDREADPFEVWERGREIGPREYTWRLARRDWAMRHDTALPEANPKKPADLAKLPSLF